MEELVVGIIRKVRGDAVLVKVTGWAASPISVTEPATKLCQTELLLDLAGQLKEHNPNAADPFLLR